MNKELEELLQRLSEILPQPPAPTDWSASIAFRWRAASRRGGAGYLQPVRQVHRIRLADLRGFGLSSKPLKLRVDSSRHCKKLGKPGER